MPACGLYLTYSAMSFAAGTFGNRMSKTFEDDLKGSLNNNCMGTRAEFSKFLGGDKRKNCGVALW